MIPPLGPEKQPESDFFARLGSDQEIQDILICVSLKEVLDSIDLRVFKLSCIT